MFYLTLVNSIAVLYTLSLMIKTFIKNRTEMTNHRNTALSLSAAALLSQILIYFASGEFFPLFTSIQVVKIFVMTSVGIYCCSLLGHPGVLLQSQPLKNALSKNSALSSISIALIFLTYSYLLFYFTEPHMSEFLKNLSSSQNTSLSSTLLMISITAIFEEVIFRLGIQSVLAKRFNWVGEKYLYSILTTSTIWSLAHIGSLQEDWIKILQIFPLGIALGYQFRNQGLEYSILSHALFNILGTCLLADLIL